MLGNSFLQFSLNASKTLHHPIVISIEGEAGIGKTTLAKMIYNDAVQVSTNFSLLLWALPPMSVDVDSVVIEIIRSFTNQSLLHLQRMSSRELMETLRGILGGQKYLLVLDDYERIHRDIHKSYQMWESLMKMFEAGSAGSTVILVSEEWVPEATMRWKLQGLPNGKSWSLFAGCAGFDEDAEKKSPSFLARIRRSLVDSCGGSPLAIKTLGSMLCSNRDENSWNQIKEKLIWNRSTIHTAAASLAFQISIEHLSSGLLQCLYVSLILSEYKVIIPKDQLILYWMALGLLHSEVGDKEEDPIHVGNIYCDELVLKCFIKLFQSDGHPMVLLHKVVQTLETIVEEVGFLPSTIRILDTCRYLFWTGNLSLTEQGLAPNRYIDTVRAFSFLKYVGFVSQIFLEELISKLIHVRILLLDGSDFEKLPESIGKLKLLRHLSFAGNQKLKALPDSLCNLRNLQTLDISGCEQLQTLPVNMGSLKHLFLSLNLTNVPEIALMSWASLHHLKICSSPNLTSLSEQIALLTALKVLQIQDCPSIASLPNSIKSLTTLTELSILNCEMLDLMSWEGLGGLRGLQYLQIQGLPKLSKFPEGIESAAQSLRHLAVSNCRSLIALPVGLSKCINLVETVIDNCPDLATLPKGMHEINTLQVLRIIDCPKLIARYQREVGDDWQLISQIPKIQLLQHPDSIYRNRAIPPLKDYPGAPLPS